MTFRYFDTPTGSKLATVPGVSYCVLRIYVHLGLSDQQQLKFIFHGQSGEELFGFSKQPVIIGFSSFENST